MRVNMKEEKIKLDRVLSIDVNMILKKGEEYHPRKLHITQILDPKLLNRQKNGSNRENEFEKCESFVAEDVYIKMKAGLCDIQNLEADIVDHLLEVIDALAYSVACYKYPDHYEHKYDKEEIFTDSGLNKEIRKRLLS